MPRSTRVFEAHASKPAEGCTQAATPTAGRRSPPPGVPSALQRTKGRHPRPLRAPARCAPKPGLRNSAAARREYARPGQYPPRQPTERKATQRHAAKVAAVQRQARVGTIVARCFQYKYDVFSKRSDADRIKIANFVAVRVVSAVQPFRARVTAGTISNRSPTAATSATSKIGASGSLLMAITVRAPFIPTRC